MHEWRVAYKCAKCDFVDSFQEEVCKNCGEYNSYVKGKSKFTEDRNKWGPTKWESLV